MGVFTRGEGHDDTMSLVEAWQVLGDRFGLDVTSSNPDAIVASGVINGRSFRVDVHRNRKASEPFQGMAEKRRRMKMRHHWTTEVTVTCTNPRGLEGAVQTFVDIRDPAWKPLDVDRSRCRIVRTDPASLAPQVLDASILERLHAMTGDYQILVEPTQIRLTVDDTSKQEEDGYFTGSPLHVEYPGPWPATFRERALVGPPWWFDLLGDVADAVDATAPDNTSSSLAATGSPWARAGGPFGPEAPGDDGRRRLVTFALLAGALVLSGIVVFALTRSSSDDTAGAEADPAVTAGTSPTTGAAGVTTVPPPTAPTDPNAVQVGQLMTGTAIATLIDEIAVANGVEPMQILSVLVYPEYLTAQVQGPDGASIVEYRWAGQLEPPTPAALVPNEDVAAALFGSDDVAWSAIPGLVDAAPAAVAVEGGVVTHLDVERSLPFSDDVRIRIYVSGPGGDGFIDGDAAGSMISINGN